MLYEYFFFGVYGQRKSMAWEKDTCMKKNDGKKINEKRRRKRQKKTRAIIKINIRRTQRKRDEQRL